MAMIGEIKLWTGNFAPVGWRFCDGSKLDAANFDVHALCSIIGDRYGSSDGRYFELPNLEPVPDKDGRGVSRYIICVEGEYPRMP
ncbi:tail fiber protein [Cyanothece sp. BG0011]|uniref:tail fiber protein n=1 Tax=Cyanothece sp. BG0011 TaxID=2082950 RepID=UPI000D1EAC75|nr:tail fiber protein [Cyanothece sp. BG0011]